MLVNQVLSIHCSTNLLNIREFMYFCKFRRKKTYHKPENAFEKTEGLDSPDFNKVTTSALPGTTLSMFEVTGSKIATENSGTLNKLFGYRVFDTYGIFTSKSLYSLMADYENIMSLTINKTIIPYSIALKEGIYSLI